MVRDNWTLKNADSQIGRTAIVTGANTGLGKETARGLAGLGAAVVIAVRSPAKGEIAREEILREFPNADIRVRQLDLSDLASISAFAESNAQELEEVDILINNAGVMVPPYGKTNDGFELQFGTNHLGHFALTLRLLPLIRASSNGRIVNVSSIAHRSGNIDFDDLAWERRDYRPSTAYGDSKIANLYFTYRLAAMLSDTPIRVTAAHPGWTATDLQRHSVFFRIMNVFFAQKPAMGTLPTLRAALDTTAKTGDYFGPKGFMELRGYPAVVQSNDLSRDESVAARLWKVSEELTGLSFKESA